MTQKRLEQYRALRREADDLERRLEALQENPIFMADRVKASMPNFPYVGGYVPMQGVAQAWLEKTKRTGELLDGLRGRIINELEAIEAFLSTVDDSDVRQIIRMRYEDGMTWEQVADEIGGTGSSRRMQLRRFFENCSTCSF